MTPEIWVSTVTLYNSSVIYHCYIDNHDDTEQPFIGLYLTPNGIISKDDTLYRQQMDKTKSHTYYSSYSVDSFEEVVERYYDHKQDMIETVNQQFSQLLLSILL